MIADVWTWWTLLCAVSALNVSAWLVSAAALHRRRGGLHPDSRAFTRWQLLLSAGYVFGCAYRSLLPVFDVPRLCLVDTWFSSVIVGRSVAMVAELCFAAQWAVLLRQASLATGSAVGRVVSRAVVPLIAVAELCSWYAVLSTSNLGHVLEESIWGLSALLLVISLVAVGRGVAPRVRALFGVLGATAAAYVLFIFGVDVPMYWARWLADEAGGRAYMDLLQGVADASTRWIVSHRWDDWKSEVLWMSLYFSGAVWLSIALIHAPVPPRLRADPAQ